MLEWYHWCDAHRKQWGDAPVGYVYLGEAVLRFGRALAGDQWRDDDLVHADVEPPKVPRLGENALSDMLEHARHSREQKLHAAKRRADAAIAHVIEEARRGLLALHIRSVKGGPLSAMPAACWDKEKSRHVFKQCVVSPEPPFRVARPREWHDVYCDEANLAARLRAMPGAKLSEVSVKDLADAIAGHRDVTQTQLVKIVSKHFADRPIPPSPNRIKTMDREMRRDGELPKRRRGRPSDT